MAEKIFFVCAVVFLQGGMLAAGASPRRCDMEIGTVFTAPFLSVVLVLGCLGDGFQGFFPGDQPVIGETVLDLHLPVQGAIHHT